MITQETPIILHHYPMSPFSEKIRAMFGYLDVQWQSALTTEMPPRPVLQSLAGGYRKIPVAQIGADIFCDTRTITPMLAAYGNQPQLTLANCDQKINDFVTEVEGDIFFACVMYGASMKLNRKVMKSMSLWQVIKFMIDRIKMGRDAIVKMPPASKAAQLVHAHLPKIEAMLESDFLFGDSPTIADFSAYHSLWFIRDMGEKPIIKEYPGIMAWMDRIKSFGHGQHTEISGEKAIEIARFSTPAAIDDKHRQHDLIGNLVTIAPSDYGLDPSTGILEACTDDRYIISRNDTKAGTVHVHFPKAGFALNKAN